MPLVKSKPYHIQTYELLKDMILSGEIVCGEKVNEMKISQQLQISRSLGTGRSDRFHTIWAIRQSHVI